MLPLQSHLGLWFFLSFREGITENYSGLFSSGGEAGNATGTEQSFGKKWGWYQSVYSLARGDVRKFGEVTKLNLHQCIMWLEFEKEKNKLEADRIKKAYKQ